VTTTSSNLLTLGTAATVTGGSNSSWLNYDFKLLTRL
jgi:hypothetical protein